MTRAAAQPGAPESLVFAVDDFGPGLSEADLVRVFEPFERGDHAGDGQGLGLGLSVSRRLAERLGGALWAEPRAEGGARFCLSLPANPIASRPSRSASAAAPARILLCEDVALVREALAKLLRRRGHEVAVFDDGAAAARAWGDGGFDLALVDWTTPGLRGAELVRRLCPPGP